MDILWIVIGFAFMMVGIIGCFLPVLPGPPLSFAGLLVLQLQETPPFETKFLTIWAGVAIAVTLLDYAVPAYGAKKLGGSKAGVTGSVIGLIVGILSPIPAGIIIGPFLGAMVGELIIGKKSGEAAKSAFGTFLGFLAGTAMKLVVSLIMLYYFFASLFW